MNYRAEIDGLRALAVIPVIFFHAGFAIFKGGYVGVDIFFVISGYLITSIIINELEKGNFTLINFYERRARRILPAMFLVMVFCIPFAWLILIPSDIKDFGESLFAVSIFSSNFLFWSESGYFDTEAELKPLLHTWSLAVEEQYYILFPAFMLLVWRFGAKFIIFTLLIIFILSFVGANWLTLIANGSKYNMGAFYLLPARGWELLLGVFCAFYIKKRGLIDLTNTNQFLSLLGFLMIMYSIFIFDMNTPIPSFYTLIPTIGTVLIILSATSKTYIYKILSYKYMVSIGLISYSAYLWHQPILAFTRHSLNGELSHYLALLICIASIIIAYISWRWVEKPFRDKKITSRKTIFRFSITGILLFSIVGFLFSASNGMEELKIKYEFSEAEKKNYALIEPSTNYDMYDYMYFKDCKIWYEDINEIDLEIMEECYLKHGSPLIIIGDSHAMNIHNIFSKSNKFNFILSIARGGCRPHSPSHLCFYDNFIKFLNNEKYLNPKVIFHQSGSYLIKDKDNQNEPSLEDEILFDKDNTLSIIKYLNDLSENVENLIWLGPFVEYRVDIKRSISEIPQIPNINFQKFSFIEEKIIDYIEEDDNFKYINFDSMFKVTPEPVILECLLWRDADHFSICGEDFISKNSNFSIFK